MGAADRGKYAEGKFRDMCKSVASTDFCYLRLPDAHAGSFTSTLADFQTLKAGKLRLIEVKQTDETNRLPYSNLDLAQVARMKMWELAKAEAWVLVYHATTKLWRCFRLSKLIARDPASGSWFFEAGRTKSELVKSDFESTVLKEVFDFIHRS